MNKEEIEIDKKNGALRQGNCGQGALEYLIFLAVLSAMVVFTAPFFRQIINSADDTLQSAEARINNPNP